MNIPLRDTSLPDYLDLALTHVSLTYDYIVHAMPDMVTLPPGAVFGTWCISVPGKVRYILAKDVELAPGVLPGDVARAWVRYNYDLPIRRRRDQRRTYPLPIMARKGIYPDAVYLDIRHAYLDILATVGYDVDYKLGKYLAAHPVILPEIVSKYKWVYAIIVAMSAGARSHMVVKTKENGIVSHPTFNLFSNPCLYALASEVLAGIASDVIRVHGSRVYYVNTDGYIVHPQAVPGVLEIVNRWGLSAREKARGETEIFGVGAWRCGNEKTLRRDSKAENFCSALPDDKVSQWLREHFTFWHNGAIVR